jgi:DNA polymerase elongation subunit (family B)
VYNSKSKSIHLWTWDAQGNRVFQELDYKPYLYLESKNGDSKSIYGTTLKKREFETLWDRNKFVKESGIRRIFENLPPYQQFLIDNYYHCNEDDDFGSHPLKVCIIDIENPHPDKMPDVELADTVINLLTCYDSLDKKYTVFGLKAYDADRKDVIYHHCKSEHDLLKKFIKYFSNDYPDVLCGWNSSGYDVPYIINRITFELGKEWADKLSPMGRIYEKINPTGKFGMPSKEYVIDGVSCLDYMVLFKKFEREKQESYKLDYIAEQELDENKVEYEGSLWNLSVNDWKRYVEYNIQDVELISKLDVKLDYISLIRFLAIQGLTSLEAAVKTVPVINGSIAIKSRERGEFIPTFTMGAKREGKNPGGYVQETKAGFVKNMVSFDANSLYPSIMISLNISPETKLGKMERNGDKFNIHHISGKTFELDKASFAKYLNEEKAAISKSGHLFSQKKKGIMAEFLDNLYTKRKAMKYKGFQLSKKLLDEKDTLSKEEISKIKYEIQKCDTFQNAYKITLNSVYGYTGTPYAAMADDDIAASVTLTGQAVNKKNKALFIECLTSIFNISEEDAEKSCIAGDTDSGYFSLGNIDCEVKDGDEVSPKFLKICDEVENYINTNISNWFVKSFRSIDSRIIYKRETICDRGIFLGKKHYILHVLDSEGIKVNKFKYAGVSVVKSTMPKLLKPHIKKVMETMITTRSLGETNKLFNDVYEKFKELPIETVSRISGINTFDKYVKGCDKFRTSKGMQQHMKAAHFFNVLLEELDIKSKYPYLKQGDKIRYLILKAPNKYGIDCVGYMGKYPQELAEIFDIDYEIMFNDLVFKSMNALYKAVNWKLRKPNENVKIELEDFFKDDN